MGEQNAWRSRSPSSPAYRILYTCTSVEEICLNITFYIFLAAVICL